MTLAHFTEPNLLAVGLRSERRDSTISVLSGLLENSGRIKSARLFAGAVLYHESRVSAVFDRVAFPSARTWIANELSFAIGLPASGVRWGIGKAPTIHAVVLFAVPPSAQQAYASLIVTFAKFLNDEETIQSLRQRGEPGEVLALLKHVPLLRTGRQFEVSGY